MTKVTLIVKKIVKLLSDPSLLKSLEKEQNSFQNPQEKNDVFVKTEPKKKPKSNGQ